MKMVAVLDVYFNDDPATKNADMTAKVVNRLSSTSIRATPNGMAIANTDFTSSPWRWQARWADDRFYRYQQRRDVV